jgi:hypothetical protein
MNNNKLELCSICGLKKKLSFEHMPPEASGNKSPVNIVGLENMTPLGGYLYQNSKKVQREWVDINYAKVVII